MVSEPQTLQEVILYFSDPVNCREYVVSRRWPKGVTCPRCGSDKVTFLEKYNRWQCGRRHPRRQFTLKTGTIFEDSPLGMDKWLTAMWLVVNCKNGVSSWEIHRALGVTQKTAWFMDHRIRLALKSGSFEKKLCGEVEADETFVGGKQHLMNNATKARRLAQGQLATGGTVGKAIVMGILERHGEARVKVVADRTASSVIPEIVENVLPGSAVFTDDLRSYRELVADYAHDFIDHTEAYVKGRIHTNGLENFWSLFKRAIKGTYVSVEPFHLQAYADEQAFRFNNRKVKDADRFRKAVDGVSGQRLTYKELTGKTESACSL